MDGVDGVAAPQKIFCHLVVDLHTDIIISWTATGVAGTYAADEVETSNNSTSEGPWTSKPSCTAGTDGGLKLGASDGFDALSVKLLPKGGKTYAVVTYPLPLTGIQTESPELDFYYGQAGPHQTNYSPTALTCTG